MILFDVFVLMNKGYGNVGLNIKLIRKSLGLSLKSFSELTGVSKSTIVNIENGHAGLKIETVNKLIFFTGFSIEDIKRSQFSIPENFQEQLEKKYKNSSQILHFFSKKPTIKTAIDTKLIYTDFFNVGREVNELVRFFQDYGWSFKGTSLQNELKKHPEIKLEPHPTKKGTFIYSKK